MVGNKLIRFLERELHERIATPLMSYGRYVAGVSSLLAQLSINCGINHIILLAVPQMLQ